MPGDEARGGRSWVLETPSATVPAAGSLIQNVRKFVCVCVCVCIYICVCVYKHREKEKITFTYEYTIQENKLI